MASLFCTEHPFDARSYSCTKCNAMQWELFATAVEEMEKHERKPTEGDDSVSYETSGKTFGRYIPSM